MNIGLPIRYHYKKIARQFFFYQVIETFARPHKAPPFAKSGQTLDLALHNSFAKDMP